MSLCVCIYIYTEFYFGSLQQTSWFTVFTLYETVQMYKETFQVFNSALVDGDAGPNLSS